MTAAWVAPFLTLTASTKRSPAAAGGKVGAMTTYLTGLAITPLLPISAEVAATLPLESPREGKEVYLATADIKEGDRLVVATVEYVVRAVAEWTDDTAGGQSYLRLFVEQIK